MLPVYTLPMVAGLLTSKGINCWFPESNLVTSFNNRPALTDHYECVWRWPWNVVLSDQARHHCNIVSALVDLLRALVSGWFLQCLLMLPGLVLVLQTCRAPLRDSSVPWVVRHHCGSGLCGVCPIYMCGWYYRHVAPLWETVQFPGVVRHHRGSGLCGVCPIYVVGITDMSSPSERQFSSLELSAIIVVAVCVVCVLYMWLLLQTCRAPLRDSSVPWSCRPSSW